MGRSASHITLECALLTRPNCAFIGEEVEQKKQTLEDIVSNLSKIIVERSQKQMNYGVILVPEGLIEFIPEMNVLIKEINEILSEEQSDVEVDAIYKNVLSKLSKPSAKLMEFLPKQISNQLLLDRDPHGNVQVAKIETEKLLIICLEKQLEMLKSDNKYFGKFSPQAHYLGYEGRCAFPTKFDCDYCYNLGVNAAVLIEKGFTGVMSCIGNLKDLVENWIPCGYPLVAMMNVEKRKGKDVPVIKKALTELNGELFKIYEGQRNKWALQDWYRQIGPIQYNFQSQYDVPYLVCPPNEKFEFGQTINSFCQFGEINLSPLNKALSEQKVEISKLLEQKKYKLVLGKSNISHNTQDDNQVQEQLKYLSKTSNQIAEIMPKSEMDQNGEENKLTIGVCFNSRQSPGGHNIIDGLLRFIEQNGGRIIGFLHGTKGLFEQNYIEINEKNFQLFRNQGGYHFLGRSSDKIRSKDELILTMKTCQKLNLDGLVLVGATHTFTDSAYLTDYFIQNNVNTKIIAIPCTIDNNLGHHMLEQSIGFDTAAKLYSQLVGNIMIDSASAEKYWYFMRLMGRDPSHLVLECALQTRPNITIISEEVVSKGWNLQDVVNYISDIIALRASQKKNFGTVLIPEGFLSHLPLFKQMIDELNEFFKTCDKPEKLLNKEFALKSLSPWAAARFSSLPEYIQKQLLLEREINDGVQLSQIETDRLLANLVEEELKQRKKNKTYTGSFAPLCHFFGYQGRSATPSLFDCKLASTYGFTAGVLIKSGLTGYATTARGLTGSVDEWHMGGIPLISFMHIKGKSSYGQNQPTINSYDVNLNSQAFLTLKKHCESWKLVDYYTNLGPTQFFGEKQNEITQTLKLNFQNYYKQLYQVVELTQAIEQHARFGVHEDLLNIIINTLKSLKVNIEIMERKF